MNDHYSADEVKPDSPVMQIECRHRHGRNKGRAFDSFILPSGEKVTIYYVKGDTHDKLPPFYAQTADQEFRARDPALLQPAVIAYLNAYQPPKYERMIVVSTYNHFAGDEGVEIFGVQASVTKMGTRGDGTVMHQYNVFNEVHESPLHLNKEDRCIPYTKERWRVFKKAAAFARKIGAQPRAFLKLTEAEMIERIDAGELFSMATNDHKIDDLWNDEG